MKMRVVLAAAALAVGSLLGPSAAQAATYDLAADLYSANQPGSAWTITYSGGPLSVIPKASVGTDNHLYPAVPSAGILSSGPSMNANTPFLFKAAVNGSQTDLDPNGNRLDDGDFLAGDLLVHSPNEGSLTITWEAPTAGVINNFEFDVWYAHSTISRSNDVSMTIAGDPNSPYSWVTSAVLNSDRGGIGALSGGGLSVNAGDLITLVFAKTSGQQFGSLSALNLSFELAPVPIPASLPLFAAGLVGLGWIARRKRQAAA